MIRHHLSSVKVLLQRLLIIILMFTICRILFVLFNLQYFNDIEPIAFIYGIRFDLSIISWLTLPLVFTHTIPFSFRYHNSIEWTNKILFHLVNIICIVMNCCDIAYYSFTLKRTTSDVISFIEFGNDLGRLLPQFIIDFWYVSLIILLLVILSSFLYKKIKHTRPLEKLNIFIQLALFCITGGLSVISARGGFQLKPIFLIDASHYVSPQNISIVLNTPFSFFVTLTNPQQVEIPHLVDEKEVKKHFSPIKSFPNHQRFQNKNVVILIMESFGTEYLNGGYMPFLDSLKKQGLFFKNAYANGKRSIDAVPSIIAGLPKLMTAPYVYSPYIGNQINSLPSLLKKKEYYSAFYHGGNNGTMGFDGFAQTAGFDDYYGRNEYPNQKDYDGKWGIFDEPYLQYFAKKLDTHPQPFLTTVFTLSSHHPYTIPTQHIGKFPKGSLDIHESIGYSDYALKKFFETAQHKEWFNNTLFVITADHTSIAQGKYYNNLLGLFRIPILFYAPNDSSLTGVSSKIAQQTDIFPSVLSYLGYDQDIIAFGNNLFDSQEKNYSITHHNNIYQYIDDNYVLHFDGKNILRLHTKEDSLFQNNIMNKKPEIAKKISKHMKYHIQSYFNHLTQNQYFIKEKTPQ